MSLTLYIENDEIRSQIELLTTSIKNVFVYLLFPPGIPWSGLIDRYGVNSNGNLPSPPPSPRWGEGKGEGKFQICLASIIGMGINCFGRNRYPISKRKEG